MLEHAQAKLEYLQYYEARKLKQSWIKPSALQSFSDPYQVNGYGHKSITDDLITDLFLSYGKQTRVPESEEYLRTLSGKLFALRCIIYYLLT